jgi:ribulose-5-phosphate 4-epimerase/fuculose-1-phosphate aldolase
MTNEISALITELVAANRVLANEGLTDGAGHISVRHPHDPQRYFLSRSRSPEFVEHTDIIEFNLNNRPIYDDGKPLYSERPIHGAIYAARPDVISVVHKSLPGGPALCDHEHRNAASNWHCTSPGRAG